MISYAGFNRIIKQKGVTKTQLAASLGISSRTMAKIAKGEPLSRATLARIADFLGCSPTDLAREVSANPVLQCLRDEKSVKALIVLIIVSADSLRNTLHIED